MMSSACTTVLSTFFRDALLFNGPISLPSFYVSSLSCPEGAAAAVLLLLKLWPNILLASNCLKMLALWPKRENSRLDDEKHWPIMHAYIYMIHMGSGRGFDYNINSALSHSLLDSLWKKYFVTCLKMRGLIIIHNHTI